MVRSPGTAGLLRGFQGKPGNMNASPKKPAALYRHVSLCAARQQIRHLPAITPGTTEKNKQRQAFPVRHRRQHAGCRRAGPGRWAEGDPPVGPGPRSSPPRRQDHCRRSRSRAGSRPGSEQHRGRHCRLAAVAIGTGCRLRRRPASCLAPGLRPQPADRQPSAGLIGLAQRRLTPPSAPRSSHRPAFPAGPAAGHHRRGWCRENHGCRICRPRHFQPWRAAPASCSCRFCRRWPGRA